MTELSIIIPNYNTKNFLEKCLYSIKENPPSSTYEVIVIDDASEDGSREMIEKKFPLVKLIWNKKNLGLSKSFNIAIRKSSGSFILLLNSDTLIFPKSIDEMLSTLEANPDAGIAGCRLLNKDGSTQFTFGYFPFPFSFIKRKLFKKKLKEKREPFAVDWVCYACVLIKREVIQDIGLFDEDFVFYNEEIDYSYRAKKKGWNTIYTPRASIIHFQGGWVNTKGTDYMRENTLRSNYLFLKKHKGIFEAVPAVVFLKLKYLFGK
ncbi:MAG: glycosyltransferase family 2 protein [archaeon]